MLPMVNFCGCLKKFFCNPSDRWVSPVFELCSSPKTRVANQSLEFPLARFQSNAFR
jgi:hypothetical protein